MSNHDYKPIRAVDLGCKRFPGPWVVATWVSGDGRRIIGGVRSADGEVVIATDDEAHARAVRDARNEMMAGDDAEFVRARWQLSLDAAHEETDRVRKRWHEEAGKLRDEVYRLQDELKKAKDDAEKFRELANERAESKPAGMMF